jgi:uncharacterized protein
MNTSLDHLPEEKKHEILGITKIIKEVLNPEKIILFGSYATGNWVVDRYVEDNALYEYQSDFDILVATVDRTEPEHVLVNKITTRCSRIFKTPISPIVHEISYINESLSYGQYFFADIINEGILLYDANSVPFAKAKELTNEEKREVAQNYYNRWFDSASDFLEHAEFGFDKAIKENKPNRLNTVAFQLHQAAERFYASILLVMTGYKPKTHNLGALRQIAKTISPDLYQLFLFPPGDKHEEHIFDLLVRGYVDARYKLSYVITREEIETLLERIRKMKDIVNLACVNWIKSQ